MQGREAFGSSLGRCRCCCVGRPAVCCGVVPRALAVWLAKTWMARSGWSAKLSARGPTYDLWQARDSDGSSWVRRRTRQSGPREHSLPEVVFAPLLTLYSDFKGDGPGATLEGKTVGVWKRASGQLNMKGRERKKKEKNSGKRSCRQMILL